MQKKVLIIIIFLVFLILFGNINKEEVLPVSLSLEDNKSGYFYVVIDNLTLENINEKITEKIFAIEPYINPVYKECILQKYDNKEKSKNNYLNFLKSKERIQEYQKYLVYPIKINRVILYTTTNYLKKNNYVYEEVKEYYCKRT